MVEELNSRGEADNPASPNLPDYSGPGSTAVRQQRIFEDVIREITGTNLKAERYTSASSQRDEKLRREKDREVRTLLRLLMQDPAYRAAYESLQAAIATTREKLCDLKRHVSAAIDEQEQRHRELVARAAIDRHGQPAFWTEDGRWLDMSGTDAEVALSVEDAKSAGLPSWNDYASSQAKLDALTEAHDKLEFFERDVIHPIAERSQDEEHPLSLDELKRSKREIEDGVEAVSVAVEATLTPEAPIAASDLVLPIQGPSVPRSKAP